MSGLMLKCCCGAGGPHCVTGCGVCSCAGSSYPNILATPSGINVPTTCFAGAGLSTFKWNTPPDLTSPRILIANAGIVPADCTWGLDVDESSELYRYVADATCSGTPAAICQVSKLRFFFGINHIVQRSGCDREFQIFAYARFSSDGGGTWTGWSWVEIFTDFSGVLTCCPPLTVILANALVNAYVSPSAVGCNDLHVWGGIVEVEGHP